MFDRIRRRTTAVPVVEVDDLKAHAAHVQAALADASAQAGIAAARLGEEAKAAALQAKGWATPRVEKALHDATAAAAPRVEKAAEKSLPIVESAHDRFVDELLPKIVAAVNAAAVAAAAGADKARDAASTKLSEIAHVEPPAPPKSHRFAKVFWLVAGVVGIVGAVGAWRRSRPTTDPWAEQPWETEDTGSERLKAAAADVRYELADAAETVGEAAGETVARTREATERAAALAREAAEKARKASPRRRAAGRADAVLGDDEVTEAIETPEGTMSTDKTGSGTAPGATDEPSDHSGLPLDADKIPTDVPGQTDDPSHTAKGSDG
ncbi:hypothetical protein [Actinotalea sp. JY-7885]|uniref:hypothetical protein n=1 Tax=Actinotalea sp. JY-7885 TaxID=2758576 RepID=UPI00165E234D|nr:hypothetical protein [Actinotalea sp. JY-7885]